MTVTRTHDETAIRGVLEGVYRAWDAGDAEAFVADYREDATAILPGSYRRSKEDVRADMAAGFASYLKGSTTVDRLESIRFLGGNAAVVVSETGVRFPGETEVPAERVVYATWVLEKRDGAWLLVAYHNSPAVLPS
ncbi:SgcJ/EcaC family oxidoreductase [Streptacidiphilus sp. P02-A3a]|uniref:SgcJ/EcaC family oxidoreductase n=1 Tax=Streptacidiphilus sp. P02-A3a TaxID=2704468 RepID=UPI0015FC0BF4|nr:SgcJ/EcaC family oxidoreductase [Streptacidiphilus sp. P02-A3a]QMU70715.1 SgcJ/EcaC family oxidoreductase [Streptacidiphilus sp. P02-A3a]